MADPDTTKPYRLTFEQRDGYLYAYVEGEEDSYDISIAYWQETADEAKRLGVGSVLIEENITGTGSVLDAYRFAADIARMGFGRVAFVDRQLDHQEVNAFAELVALNRGLNCKIFNDINAAEAWLS